MDVCSLLPQKYANAPISLLLLQLLEIFPVRSFPSFQFPFMPVVGKLNDSVLTQASIGHRGPAPIAHHFSLDTTELKTKFRKYLNWSRQG